MQVHQLRRALQKCRGDEEVIICGFTEDAEPSPLVQVMKDGNSNGRNEKLFLMSDALLQDMVVRDLAQQAGIPQEG